jgi:hypothetical protein
LLEKPDRNCDKFENPLRFTLVNRRGLFFPEIPCKKALIFIAIKHKSVEGVKRWRVGVVKYIKILDLTCHLLVIAL